MSASATQGGHNKRKVKPQMHISTT